LIRFGPADLVEPPRRIGKLSVDERKAMSDPEARAQVAEKIASLRPADSEGDPEGAEPGGEGDEIRSLRRAVDSHPVAGCPELGRHLHFAERAERLEREIRNIERRIARTTGTLARRFDQVLAVLEALDHVREWELTDKGLLLTRIYNESDLLVIESLERGLFDGLEPAEIASVCSTLVYETRGPEGPPPPDMPTPACERVWRSLMQTWRRIRAEEEGRQLDLTREPDPGFAGKAFAWASGGALEDVLGEEDAPGDFVRSTKQLVDLLRQLEEIASDELRKKIGAAVDALHRGIVAYSSLDAA
jgi:ATP-dependent RNA helicase HelY